ncbi:MAG: flagellar basal body rod C-terminal domain-containing protein, partial [Pseudomonadota bacterium]
LTALNAPTTGVGEFVTFSLNADGALTTTPNAGFSGYDVLIEQDATSRAGSGVAFTDLFGLGPGAVAGQAIGMQVRDDIANDPRLLAGAQLEIGPTTALGDTVVTVGDNRGLLAMEAAQNERIAFAPAGELPASVSTISEYAIQTLNNFAARARGAETASQNAEALREDIEFRRETVQGVNLDEELATMLIYQQAYNASARLIGAAQSLYDALLNVV